MRFPHGFSGTLTYRKITFKKTATTNSSQLFSDLTAHSPAAWNPPIPQHSWIVGLDLGVPWVRLFRINTLKGYSAELFIFVFVFVLSAIEVLSGFARVCCTCAGRGRELVSSMGRGRWGLGKRGDWEEPTRSYTAAYT